MELMDLYVISVIAEKVDKPYSDVLMTIWGGSSKYKVYSIPKRTHGRRIIAHPSKDLKELQRAFVSIFDFPLHSCAMAYRKGMSIKENAEAHSKQNYLLKMDLENFFNSITPDAFWEIWEKAFPAHEDIEKRIIENLLFWGQSADNGGKLVLSVGAPSSPAISNFFMYYFDQVIYEFCFQNHIIYTRYADDLTFSSNKKGSLFEIPNFVKSTLDNCFGKKLVVNHQKTVFSSKAHNRHVTGITLTNEGTISLGRDKKRYIKHLVYQYKLKKLSVEDINHLKGYLSYANHIEPNFIESLRIKYSQSLIKELFNIKRKCKDEK